LGDFCNILAKTFPVALAHQHLYAAAAALRSKKRMKVILRTPTFAG
jgi:hypothetical protein